MSGLSAFLAENVKKDSVEKFVASQRFQDENGNPISWEIGCITSKEDDKLRRDATDMVKVKGKKGQYARETDYGEYLSNLAVRCTIFPNLNDEQLQSSYGVMGAKELLKTMLKPGEYQRYLVKVQEVNGFDEDMEELVEEAKN